MNALDGFLRATCAFEGTARAAMYEASWEAYLCGLGVTRATDGDRKRFLAHVRHFARQAFGRVSDPYRRLNENLVRCGFSDRALRSIRTSPMSLCDQAGLD